MANTTSKKRTRRSDSDDGLINPQAGLKQLSKLVLQEVVSAKATSYADVAQRLIERMKKDGTLPSLHTDGSDAQDPKESEQQTQQEK